MIIRSLIETSTYYDSVTLMLVARELSTKQGVVDVAIMMGTEANKAIMREAGLLTKEAETATANDLMVAVKAVEASAADDAISEVDQMLNKQGVDGEISTFLPKTINSGLLMRPGLNVAVISVAGRYAVAEAWEALYKGLHVMLFSDNISVEDEISLKKHALKHGLLLMGPGAGTTILNNIGLGFANAIKPGNIGIISAAGTGLQEVSSLLTQFGAGVSQGIGVGGRDLSADVGGLMTLEVLKSLQQDPTTDVIVMISKPPAPEVVGKIFSQIDNSKKPTILCFLGAEVIKNTQMPNLIGAETLQEAAVLAAENTGLHFEDLVDEALEERAHIQRASLGDDQKYIRGLFSGGTLCFEAQLILKKSIDSLVYSNAPLLENRKLPDPNVSIGHSLIDLGAEEFTFGRLHPMIDYDLRLRRLAQEADDPHVAVILLDVVLGYGAHPNPAAELVPKVEIARASAAEEGRCLIIIASVTGTQADPQGRSQTILLLEQAGVLVADCNAAAARLAGKMI